MVAGPQNKFGRSPERDDVATPPLSLTDVWLSADRRLADVPVDPRVIDVLASASLAEGESAWIRPAMTSFFDEHGEPEEAEQFFAELKELSLAIREQSVERRYAPWARTTAIADLPSTTLGALDHDVTPVVWFARWVGTFQRLGPVKEALLPFLENLADEAPVLTDDEPGTSPDETSSGVTLFSRLVRALVEPGEAVIPVTEVVPTGESSGAATDEAESYLRLCRQIPRGVMEPALKGRILRYSDGISLRFLRFPRFGDMTWDGGPSRLMFEVDQVEPRIPRRVAAALGERVLRGEQTLRAEAERFGSLVDRSLARFKSDFATEIVERALTAPSEM